MVRSWSPKAGGVAAVAAALALSLTTPSTSAATEEPGTEPTTSTLSIVTYNAGAKVRVAPAMADLQRLMDRDPDVITLQEMASGEKRKKIRATYLDCETCVWDAYMPGRSAEYPEGDAVKAGTPILYRSDRLELQQSGTTLVSPGGWVGEAGAGPSTIQPKYVNWVRFRDLRSGRPIHVFNNHTVPSVQGKDGGPNRNMPARLRIYRQHMNGLQDLVREVTADVPKGLTFVTGDLNVNYRRDKVLQPALFPYRRMGALGMRANWYALGEPRIGTHTLDNGNGTRLIDYVYFLPQRTLTPSRQRILRDYASDHRPVQVTFEVRNRPVVVTEPEPEPEPTTP